MTKQIAIDKYSAKLKGARQELSKWIQQCKVCPFDELTKDSINLIAEKDSECTSLVDFINTLKALTND